MTQSAPKGSKPLSGLSRGLHVDFYVRFKGLSGVLQMVVKLKVDQSTSMQPIGKKENAGFLREIKTPKVVSLA